MNFYILKQAFGNYAQPIRDGSKTTTDFCPQCGGSHVTRLSPLRVFFKGKRETDFYNAPPYKIISPALQNVLTQHGFTGFSFDELEITGWYDSKKKPIDKNATVIKEWVINGRAGKLRKLNGDFVFHCEICGRVLPEGQKEVKGISVDPTDWDGSDVFYFENWFGMPIVTEPVKKALEKVK